MPAPELAALVDAYRGIFTRLAAGQVTLDEAWGELANLTAVDSYGATWTLSPDHGPDNPVFLRAEPGSGPLPADPATFTPVLSTAPTVAADGFSDPSGTVPLPRQGAWTDNPMDLMEPPATPGSAWDDTWSPGDSPFPADTIVGEPTDTGWDPFTGQRDTQAPFEPTPQPQPGAVHQPPPEPKTSPLTGAKEFLSNAAGAAGDVWASADQGRRRKLLVAALCVVAVIAFVVLERRGQSDSPAAAATFSYDCPKPTATIVGADGEAGELLGCLDGDEDPGSDARGPHLAIIAVTAADGTVTYRPDNQVSNAQAAQTAARLYGFAGGTAPQSGEPVDLTGLSDDTAAAVQSAFDLGLLSPGTLTLTDTATRQTQALLLYRALTRANVIPDSPAGERPSDSPAGDPEPGQAVAALRAAGIVDGAPTDPFNFSGPMIVSDWVLWAGRATHEIRDPGSMQRRIAAEAAATSTTASPSERPPAPGASAAGATGSAPDAARVSAVIAAATSGDEQLVAGAVKDPGEGLDAAKTRAMWVGLVEAGATVAAQGPAAADGDGAVQVWEITGGGVDTTVKVTWVTVDGVWMLTTLPQL